MWQVSVPLKTPASSNDHSPLPRQRKQVLPWSRWGVRLTQRGESDIVGQEHEQKHRVGGKVNTLQLRDAHIKYTDRYICLFPSAGKWGEKTLRSDGLFCSQLRLRRLPARGWGGVLHSFPQLPGGPFHTLELLAWSQWASHIMIPEHWFSVLQAGNLGEWWNTPTPGLHLSLTASEPVRWSSHVGIL